jgi:hypothetical protein
MMRAWLAVLAVAGFASVAVAAMAPITPEGWGDLRIGMPAKEAIHRFGLKEPNRIPGEDSCRQFDVPAEPQLDVMVIDGRVVRLSLYSRGPLKTDRGFTVGDRERDIRKAYGPRLKVEPHAYEEAPAHYLTFWTTPGKRGVRYETDMHGRVTSIHVGGPEIQFIEGCL